MKWDTSSYLRIAKRCAPGGAQLGRSGFIRDGWQERHTCIV